DYLHVEGGPGVVLVSHEANIGLDGKVGECGLSYLRKSRWTSGFGASFSDRVATVLGSALAAANLLQRDLPQVSFRTDRLQLRIADKLNAPNDTDAARKILPQL